MGLFEMGTPAPTYFSYVYTVHIYVQYTVRVRAAVGESLHSELVNNQLAAFLGACSFAVLYKFIQESWQRSTN